jgi:hypothetical protein
VQLNIPLPEGLFEPIQQTIYLAYPVRMKRVFKTRRLLHVDQQIKAAIEESCGEVNLKALSVPNGKQTAYQAQGFQL